MPYHCPPLNEILPSQANNVKNEHLKSEYFIQNLLIPKIFLKKDRVILRKKNDSSCLMDKT